MEVFTMARKIDVDWKELIKKQSKSNKTVTEFCREHSIHPNTFYSHRKKIGVGNFVEIIPTPDERKTGRVLVEYEKLRISIGPDSEKALRTLFSVLGIIE
jgi:transposase-like protein